MTLKKKFNFKNWFHKRKKLLFSLLVFLIVIFAFLYFLKPFNRIEKIEVYSNYKESENRRILTKNNLKNGQPYWRWVGQSQTIQSALKKKSAIKSTKLKLYPKDNLAVLHIKERKYAGYVLIKNQWYRINSHGKIENRKTYPHGFLPTYTNFNLKSNFFLKTIRNFLSLRKAVRNSISQIVYLPSIKNNNKKSLVLVINDGNLVYCSPKTMGKLNFYQEMVSSMKKRGLTNGSIILNNGYYARPFDKMDNNIFSKSSLKK